MELIARLRVTGSDTETPGNVALFEIALDACASMIALLATRSVAAGEALVLSSNHATVVYREDPYKCTVLKAFPRVEPFSAVVPPTEGMWALCDREILDKRVKSLVKTPVLRAIMFSRLKGLLPHVNFRLFEREYLTTGKEEAYAAHPPNFGIPRGHEPGLAGRGEARRRFWDRKGSEEYFAGAEEIRFEQGLPTRKGLGYSWFKGAIFKWPVDKVVRAPFSSSEVARAVKRLVLLRKPVVGRVTL